VLLVPEHIVVAPDIAATDGTVVNVTVDETAVVEPHALVAVMVYTPALNEVTPDTVGFCVVAV
jgi:hypothetical protein